VKSLPKTCKQLRHIWALAHEMGYEDEDLRARVLEIFPETGGHLSKLTYDQASQLISLFRERMGKPVHKHKFGRLKRDEHRPFMSPSQHNLAFRLASEICDLEPGKWITVYRLLDRLALRDGAESYDQCTTRQAAHVIEALKAMKERLTKNS